MNGWINGWMKKWIETWAEGCPPLVGVEVGEAEVDPAQSSKPELWPLGWWVGVPKLKGLFAWIVGIKGIVNLY